MYVLRKPRWVLAIGCHVLVGYKHATALLASGTHPEVVRERLGHSSISVTIDIYSSVVPGMQREAVEKLAKTMKRNR